MPKEARRRSVIKSIIWRAIGIAFLALITWLFTRSLIATTLITVLHHSIFIIVYYLHERFWLRLRTSKWRPVAKMITYEVVLANIILGLIAWAITGVAWQATAITLTYTVNKMWMYIVYDLIWGRVKWGKKPTTVYAYVVADLLHVGHLRALQQAKALGDHLIVGVLTDEAVAAYKRWPIIPFEERIELVASLKCVDEVMRQDSVNPTENLKKLDVDIVTHGDDWDENFPGSEYMRSVGKKSIRTKYYYGQSTTDIIKKIRGGIE